MQGMLAPLDALFASIHALTNGRGVSDGVRVLCKESRKDMANLRNTTASRALRDELTASARLTKRTFSNSTETLRLTGIARGEAAEALNKCAGKREKSKSSDTKLTEAQATFEHLDEEYNVRYNVLNEKRSQYVPKVLNGALALTHAFAHKLATTVGDLVAQVEANRRPFEAARGPSAPQSVRRIVSPVPQDPAEHAYVYPPVASVAGATGSVAGTRIRGIPLRESSIAADRNASSTPGSPESPHEGQQRQQHHGYTYEPDRACNNDVSVD